MVYFYICFSLPDDQTKKNEGEIKVKKIQKLQGKHPIIYHPSVHDFFVPNV